MHTRTVAIPLAVACLAACAAAPARASDAASVSLSAGAEYSTGDYGGDASVDETYLPLTAAVDFERVSVRVVVPMLVVRAPELTVIDGGDGQPIVGEGPVTTTSGLGDVVLSATAYDVYVSSGGGLALDLTGKVKLGTADADSGLGTGATDYSVQADVFRFFDRFTLMGTLGYSLRGDPQGYELDDTPYASVGGSWSWRDGASIAAFYDYRAAAYAGAPASSELSGSVTAPLGRRGRAEFYVSTGLSDGSPDWAAGLSLRVTY